MMKKRVYGKKTKSILVMLVMALLLTACGEREPERNGDGHYEIPEFLDVVYDEASAKKGKNATIDVSHASDGYFAATHTGNVKTKVQVMKDNIIYNYDITNDGEVSFYPFQSGDGHYVIRIMEQVEDNKYSETFRVAVDVTLNNEFMPFLHAGIYMDYTEESECVKYARELAEQSIDSIDFIGKVYQYVVKNISYDNQKAKTVTSGYIPVPDEIMRIRKGICFDYACLAACMLRSQGIPTKMIWGYVAPNDIFHAWNMVYTPESGWITVKFSVDQNTWNRVDLTFSAGGASSNFVGDGTNYADVYEF